MKDTNRSEVSSINERVFQQMARFECEASKGTSSYVPCGKPATKVVEWRHQDGDRERRALCQKHALKQQKYWSAMDWDTGVEVSNIEAWDLSIRYSVGRLLLGRKFPDAVAYGTTAIARKRQR